VALLAGGALALRTRRRRSAGERAGTAEPTEPTEVTEPAEPTETNEATEPTEAEGPRQG